MATALTLMYSSASSGVNAPLSRRRSTKQTAMHPSTFKISCNAFFVFSTLITAQYNGTHRVLLCRGDLLNSKSVVEQAVAGEVLAHVFLDKLDTEIGVVDALDLVTDTGDWHKVSFSFRTSHRKRTIAHSACSPCGCYQRTLGESNQYPARWRTCWQPRPKHHRTGFQSSRDQTPEMRSSPCRHVWLRWCSWHCQAIVRRCDI